ncbi:carboxylesterase family protein [Streptomyces sp. SID2999]|nr:carboxylesterase family protein [Streptomyces sp. SID2999]
MTALAAGAARLSTHQVGLRAREALCAEAQLTPKPGLVDTRGGAHGDMTLELLLVSADTLAEPRRASPAVREAMTWAWHRQPSAPKPVEPSSRTNRRVHPVDKTVSISSGKISGREIADGIWSWLGIPYAAPPLGQLRWQPPQPAQA